MHLAVVFQVAALQVPARRGLAFPVVVLLEAYLLGRASKLLVAWQREAVARHEGQASDCHSAQLLRAIQLRASVLCLRALRW